MNGINIGLSELPDGWVWTTLGEITEPSKEKVNPLEIKEVPYISLEHIEKDTGKLLGQGSSIDVRSSKTKFTRGDLLYGKLRPYLNKVYISDFEGVCSTDLLVFPQNELLPNTFFLYRFLCRDFVNYTSHNVSGVNLPRVNFQTLSQFKILLPPLPEQHRIAAKIEELFTKLDAGKEELLQAKARLKRYRQSVLKAAMEGQLTEDWRREHGGEIEPASVLLDRILKERREKWEAEQLEQMRAKGKMPKDDKWKNKYKEPQPSDTSKLPELPEGWVWTTVGEIAQTIHYGYTESAINDPVGPKFLRITDIQNNSVNWDSVPYCRIDGIKQQKYLLKEGDLVFARTGATVGKSFLIQGSIPDAVFASYLIRIVLNKKINANFIYTFFQSQSYWVQIHQGKVGIGQPNVNAKILSQITLPLPSLFEQQAIVFEVERRLSVADAVEATVDAELKRSDALRQSILKQAFSGQLVPQDSNDEPAEKLLARIKKEKAKRETAQNRKGKKQLALFGH